MKIVHIIIGKANPERMNGVNKVVDGLATEMSRQGMDVEVWGLTRKLNDPTPKRPYDLRLFSFTSNPYAVDEYLQNAIENLPVKTLVHFHGVFAPPYFRMTRLLRERHIPWIVTPHGALLPNSLQRRGFLKKIYVHLFDRHILQDAKGLHAITNAEQKALQKWNKTAVIPNGTLVRPVKDAANDRLVFGYVGRFDARHKGLDILLDGFRHYTLNGGKGELWLVGDGPHKAVLQAKAYNWPIRFYAPHFGTAKDDLVQKMSVFVHTSRWDVMPTAILEAAALSRPLLLSAETGLAEMNAKWGSGFNIVRNRPQDVATALKACEDLHEAGQLAVKGRQAAAMIENDLNWTNSLEHMKRHFYGT